MIDPRDAYEDRWEEDTPRWQDIQDQHLAEVMYRPTLEELAVEIWDAVARQIAGAE